MKGEKLETVGVGRKCLALWKCQAPIHLAGLFFLALLPRLFGLSTFMTPDEGLWMERTALFGQALLRGDWADTFQSGHPGVTTKWLGLAGLAGEYLVSRDEACLAPTGSPEAWGLSPREDFRSFLAAVPKSCARHLAAARLPIVLLSALSVGAIYLLCRKLFGWQVALLAGVLIAFDPFFLAHSRFLHHDALLTIFMSLSLLSFLIYLREGCSGWLFLSAVCGGLAFLSKASGLFLAPLLGLLALVQIKSAIEFPPYFGAGFVIRWVLTMAVWAIAASLAVFFFWPAMWVNPGSTAQAVLANSLEYAAEGHQFGSFFLGRAALDPGPFFYPLNLLFRLTPPVLAGLAFAIYLVAGDVAG
ncbi:MAG: ArnT family glycosyltransferase, partial [Anaerolineae bacterium]